MYETHKVATANRKIITTLEGAEYYSVSAGVLKGELMVEGVAVERVWAGELVMEGDEVTLSLKGCAIPEGGIQAHRH